MCVCWLIDGGCYPPPPRVCVVCTGMVFIHRQIALDDGVATPRRPKRRLGDVEPGSRAFVTIAVNQLTVRVLPDPTTAAAAAAASAGGGGGGGSGRKGGKAAKAKGGKGKKKSAAAEPVATEPVDTQVKRYAVRVRFPRRAAADAGGAGGAGGDDDDVMVVSPFVSPSAEAVAEAEDDGVAIEVGFEERVAVPLSTALRDQVYFHGLNVDVLVQQATRTEVRSACVPSFVCLFAGTHNRTTF